MHLTPLTDGMGSRAGIMGSDVGGEAWARPFVSCEVEGIAPSLGAEENEAMSGFVGPAVSGESCEVRGVVLVVRW